VLIIHQGRLVADGSVPELLQRTGAPTLERVFNQPTATEKLLERAEEFARQLR
jgi:ABC-type Na+ transport system ATPase subunit NatA